MRSWCQDATKLANQFQGDDLFREAISHSAELASQVALPLNRQINPAVFCEKKSLHEIEIICEEVRSGYQSYLGVLPLYNVENIA